MGVYRPREQLHRIRKENIGLIEALAAGIPVEQFGENIARHGLWAAEIAKVPVFTSWMTQGGQVLSVS